MKGLRLFEPLSKEKIHLKNRIVLAPLTRARAGRDRIPNELMAQYYYQRSGAGMLISEATVISKQGIGWIDSPGIFTPEMVDGWKKINEKIKPTETHFFLQLWHCGRASHSDFHDGASIVSASAIKLKGDCIHTPFGKKEYETPRALLQDEIKNIVHDYRTAALHAKEASFSGVEIHAANGYLINQFLDSQSNKRDDTYGGDFENRFRFLREIVEAILTVWPPELVSVRISPNGVFNDMGSDDFRETYLSVAKQLNSYKIGFLHIMDGLAFGFHNKGEPMTLQEFRPLFQGTIIGNCGYTKELAEKRLSEKTADLIAFGRPFISNPDLPNRFKNNWQVAPFDDMSHWYGSGSQGYTDYPSFG